MSDANIPCVPRTGRALTWLRFRYRLLTAADKWCHRLGVHDHNGVWPCFESDDIWLERFLHDQRFHDERLKHMTKVKTTKAPVH